MVVELECLHTELIKMNDTHEKRRPAIHKIEAKNDVDGADGNSLIVVNSISKKLTMVDS